MKEFNVGAGEAMQHSMNDADRLYEAHLANSDAYKVEISVITSSIRPEVEYILLRREHAEALIGPPKSDFRDES